MVFERRNCSPMIPIDSKQFPIKKFLAGVFHYELQADDHSMWSFRRQERRGWTCKILRSFEKWCWAMTDVCFSGRRSDTNLDTNGFLAVEFMQEPSSRNSFPLVLTEKHILGLMTLLPLSSFACWLIQFHREAKPTADENLIFKLCNSFSVELEVFLPSFCASLNFCSIKLDKRVFRSTDKEFFELVRRMGGMTKTI